MTDPSSVFLFLSSNTLGLTIGGLSESLAYYVCTPSTVQNMCSTKTAIVM